jgi:hypothetical protein
LELKKQTLANVHSEDPSMLLPLDFRFPKAWPSAFIDRLQFWLLPNSRKWMEESYAEIEAFTRVFPARGGTCCSRPFALPFQFEMKDVRAFFMVQIQPDGELEGIAYIGTPAIIEREFKMFSELAKEAP